MAFTFATLKTAIQDYTENTDTTFVSNLNNFIKGSEERILKSVQLSLFRKNASGSMTSGNKYLAVPTDYLASFSLSFTNSSLAGEEYVGFQNYEKMLSSKKFNKIVIRTFVWMFFSNLLYLLFVLEVVSQ